MKPVVFVQTNAKQRLGAMVSAFSFRRNAREPDSFSVRIIDAADYPVLLEAGRTILRDGRLSGWNPDDLQSFSPLRFAAPDLMAHRGLALVVDPDVFAVGDVGELLTRDLQGKAIWCRPRPGYKGRPDYLASSVMLLDCALLPHWRFAADLRGLWERRFDYADWIELRLEDPATIGLLEPEWNDFDHLGPATRLLHNTRRRTQPWKTGLPIEFTPRDTVASRLARPFRALMAQRYRRHPDPRQQALFYALLADAIDAGTITNGYVEREIAAMHVRPDSLALVDRYRSWFRPAEPSQRRAA